MLLPKLLITEAPVTERFGTAADPKFPEKTFPESKRKVVPAANVMFRALEAEPKAPPVVPTIVPLLRVMLPLKVLAPLRVSVLDEVSLMMEPVPLMMPDNV